MDSSERRRRQDSDNEERGRRGGRGSDDPPNSRLFVMCSPRHTEEQLTDAFKNFGRIEDVWIVKDRKTQESKGIAYVKFAKTSEAALAMEEMNGQAMNDDPRPLKVLIANSKDQGSRRDQNEEERSLRLFVTVPKTMNESELKREFGEFGDIDYVLIVRDKSNNQSKGFAYVKYHRATHAAKAFENCDPSYRAIFAEPKPAKPRTTQDHGNDRRGSSPSRSRSISSGFNAIPETPTRLVVSAPYGVTQDQMWKLFDLIPGLDFCDKQFGATGFLQNSYALGSENQFIVQYNNQTSAVYAKEKIHGFEYPPGNRLIVVYDGKQAPPPLIRGPIKAPVLPNLGSRPNADILHLTETIAQATALLKATGYSGGAAGVDASAPPVCSVKLPPPQPLAPSDAEVEERLFIVCTPDPPATSVLTDVFSRFGNLIEVYLLGRKTCGYAKYASKESANRAVQVLNGQELNGNKLKVILADPQEAGRKRPKFD